MIDGSCRECRYFDPDVAPIMSSDQGGVCRRNPPVALPAALYVVLDSLTGGPDQRWHGVWPPVFPHDWCGNFAPQTDD